MEELFCSLKISNLNGDVNLEEIIDQPEGKSAQHIASNCIEADQRLILKSPPHLFSNLKYIFQP